MDAGLFDYLGKHQLHCPDAPSAFSDPQPDLATRTI